jgi:hypothetical protein
VVVIVAIERSPSIPGHLEPHNAQQISRQKYRSQTTPISREWHRIIFQAREVWSTGASLGEFRGATFGIKARSSLARPAGKPAGGNLGEASIRRILAGDPTVRRASIALNE